MRETDAYTMVSLSSPVSTNYTNKSTKRLKGRVFFTNTDNVDIMFCLFLHIINIQNTIPIPKVISIIRSKWQKNTWLAFPRSRHWDVTDLAYFSILLCHCLLFVPIFCLETQCHVTLSVTRISISKHLTSLQLGTRDCALCFLFENCS